MQNQSPTSILPINTWVVRLFIVWDGKQCSPLRFGWMSPSGGLDPLTTVTWVVLIMNFISILPPAHCWWGRIPRPLATENTLLMDLLERSWAVVRCWRVEWFCRKVGHRDGFLTCRLRFFKDYLMDKSGLLFGNASLLDRDGVQIKSPVHKHTVIVLKTFVSCQPSDQQRLDYWWLVARRMEWPNTWRQL